MNYLIASKCVCERKKSTEEQRERRMEEKNKERSPSAFAGFSYWFLPKPTKYSPNLFSTITVPHASQPMKLAEKIRWLIKSRRQGFNIVCGCVCVSVTKPRSLVFSWFSRAHLLISGRVPVVLHIHLSSHKHWDLERSRGLAWSGLILRQANSTATWYSSGQRIGWPSVRLNFRR